MQVSCSLGHFHLNSSLLSYAGWLHPGTIASGGVVKKGGGGTDKKVVLQAKLRGENFRKIYIWKLRSKKNHFFRLCKQGVPLDQALRASELNPLEQAVLSCAWKAPQQGIQHGWGEVWKL